MEQNNSLQIAEPQNTQPTHSHSNITKLSPTQKAIANTMRDLSLAGNPSFPIPNVMIADMSLIISEESPEITPEILKKIVRLMITGKIPYDPNKGIRNIFEGYAKYKDLRECIQIYNVNTGVRKATHEDYDNASFNKTEWVVWEVLNAKMKYPSDEYKKEVANKHGFHFIDKHILRDRDSYLRHCVQENIQPDDFFNNDIDGLDK